MYVTLEEKLLFNRLISLKSFIFLTVCLFAIVACGGYTSDTTAPTVSTEPAAEQPAAKAEAPVVETAKAEPVVESSAVSVTKYQDFGFSLEMESGAMANTMAGSTDSAGTATFNYGGVNAMLNWVPGTNFDAVGAVKGLFTAVQNSNTSASFTTVGGGELRVGFESGEYIAYTADGSGGGLIGAWTCLDTDTAFTLFVSGQDSTNVQLRFKRLIDQFDCDGSADTAGTDASVTN